MNGYTKEELEKHTCNTFGGSNCVLYVCMFGCQLEAAKRRLKESNKK